MTALTPVTRLLCSHDFFWSRRRGGDVCRRCGIEFAGVALNFRSRTSWTVGADLPPVRSADQEFSDAMIAPHAATAEILPLTPASFDVLTAALPPVDFGDFSGRSAARLAQPLVIQS